MYKNYDILFLVFVSNGESDLFLNREDPALQITIQK